MAPSSGPALPADATPLALPPASPRRASAATSLEATPVMATPTPASLATRASHRPAEPSDDRAYGHGHGLNHDYDHDQDHDFWRSAAPLAEARSRPPMSPTAARGPRLAAGADRPAAWRPPPAGASASRPLPAWTPARSRATSVSLALTQASTPAPLTAALSASTPVSAATTPALPRMALATRTAPPSQNRPLRLVRPSPDAFATTSVLAKKSRAARLETPVPAPRAPCTPVKGRSAGFVARPAAAAAALAFSPTAPSPHLPAMPTPFGLAAQTPGDPHSAALAAPPTPAPASAASPSSFASFAMPSATPFRKPSRAASVMSRADLFGPSLGAVGATPLTTPLTTPSFLTSRLAGETPTPVGAAAASSSSTLTPPWPHVLDGATPGMTPGPTRLVKPSPDAFAPSSVLSKKSKARRAAALSPYPAAHAPCTPMKRGFLPFGIQDDPLGHHSPSRSVTKSQATASAAAAAAAAAGGASVPSSRPRTPSHAASTADEASRGLMLSTTDEADGDGYLFTPTRRSGTPSNKRMRRGDRTPTTPSSHAGGQLWSARKRPHVAQAYAGPARPSPQPRVTAHAGLAGALAAASMPPPSSVPSLAAPSMVLPSMTPGRSTSRSSLGLTLGPVSVLTDRFSTSPLPLPQAPLPQPPPPPPPSNIAHRGLMLSPPSQASMTHLMSGATSDDTHASFASSSPIKGCSSFTVSAFPNLRIGDRDDDALGPSPAGPHDDGVDDDDVDIDLGEDVDVGVDVALTDDALGTPQTPSASHRRRRQQRQLPPVATATDASDTTDTAPPLSPSGHRMRLDAQDASSSAAAAAAGAAGAAGGPPSMTISEAMLSSDASSPQDGRSPSQRRDPPVGFRTPAPPVPRAAHIMSDPSHLGGGLSFSLGGGGGGGGLSFHLGNDDPRHVEGGPDGDGRDSQSPPQRMDQTPCRKARPLGQRSPLFGSGAATTGRAVRSGITLPLFTTHGVTRTPLAYQLLARPEARVLTPENLFDHLPVSHLPRPSAALHAPSRPHSRAATLDRSSSPAPATPTVARSPGPLASATALASHGALPPRDRHLTGAGFAAAGPSAIPHLVPRAGYGNGGGNGNGARRAPVDFLHAAAPAEPNYLDTHFHVLGILGKGEFSDAYMVRRRTRLVGHRAVDEPDDPRRDRRAAAASTSTPRVGFRFPTSDHDASDEDEDEDEEEDEEDTIPCTPGAEDEGGRAPPPTPLDVLAAASAVKATRIPYTGVKDRQRKLEEVGVMFALRGQPGCVQLRSAWEQHGILYIETELCSGGSLAQYLEEQDAGVPELTVWTTLTELTATLAGLHALGVVHLDLKPANVFITGDGALKLGDFGLARFLDRPSHSDVEGDRRYMAPELLEGRVSFAADIFSLGLMALEMAANVELPENGPAWTQLRHHGLESVSLKDVSQPLVDLIRSMIHPDPAFRPQARDILRHPLIATVAEQAAAGGGDHAASLEAVLQGSAAPPSAPPVRAAAGETAAPLQPAPSAAEPGTLSSMPSVLDADGVGPDHVDAAAALDPDAAHNLATPPPSQPAVSPTLATAVQSTSVSSTMVTATATVTTSVGQPLASRPATSAVVASAAARTPSSNAPGSGAPIKPALSLTLPPTRLPRLYLPKIQPRTRSEMR